MTNVATQTLKKRIEEHYLHDAQVHPPPPLPLFIRSSASRIYSFV